MMGLYSDYAVGFLWVLGLLTTTVFAIPLFCVPLQWARRMKWQVPQETDLAVYFGRCLGACVLVAEFFIFRSAITGSGLTFTFQLLAAIFSLMMVVHIYGALRQIQPITETLEIGFWALLLLAVYLFYPGGL
ncbi:hypothetical protein [Marinobacter zhejiangensis]|uniref:DUF4345 domain-containing protein n=1 Tax=Marinobacter zhejiangensis TaxID=488535 RepID=A0A1I4T463_9GAMM|nr:hypothetical protein [Marinobacter zhejiangensis]SFM71476.1 hypothetical protein SAMN04487963_3487 [Marinobacter zhejiangensis]